MIVRWNDQSSFQSLFFSLSLSLSLSHLLSFSCDYCISYTYFGGGGWKWLIIRSILIPHIFTAGINLSTNHSQSHWYVEVRFRREVPVTRTVLFRESLLIPVTFFRVRSHCTSATGTIIQSYLSHGRGYRWLNRFRHQDFLVRRLTRQLAGLKAKRVKWRLNLLADQRLYRKRPIAILDPPLYTYSNQEKENWCTICCWPASDLVHLLFFSRLLLLIFGEWFWPNIPLGIKNHLDHFYTHYKQISSSHTRKIHIKNLREMPCQSFLMNLLLESVCCPNIQLCIFKLNFLTPEIIS